VYYNSLDEMQAILEAAQGNDPERAWHCCLAHVQRAAIYALQSFEGATGWISRRRRADATRVVPTDADAGVAGEAEAPLP